VPRLLKDFPERLPPASPASTPRRPCSPVAKLIPTLSLYSVGATRACASNSRRAPACSSSSILSSSPIVCSLDQGQAASFPRVLNLESLLIHKRSQAAVVLPRHIIHTEIRSSNPSQASSSPSSFPRLRRPAVKIQFRQIGQPLHRNIEACFLFRSDPVQWCIGLSHSPRSNQPQFESPQQQDFKPSFCAIFVQIWCHSWASAHIHPEKPVAACERYYQLPFVSGPAQISVFFCKFLQICKSW
jgi:hypothetical protein